MPTYIATYNTFNKAATALRRIKEISKRHKLNSTIEFEELPVIKKEGAYKWFPEEPRWRRQIKLIETYRIKWSFELDPNRKPKLKGKYK